ncbi:MAG: hypothetical protein J6L47_02845 [Alphaproteobacteria bacterium]|nr:hypothetical protein [Alphaproteobacteria bacterium]
MAKFCVFCGNPPENKNAEHIIPQWLIEMTGKKSRPCHLGPITPNGSIAFGAFKFPACERCNSEFSALEASVKPIIQNILAGTSVTGNDLHILLNWFDKVRIGLWLADLCLTKKVDEINPHMHIANRMGLKDRMLVIERIAPCDDCINFIGPGNVSFRYAPSVFQLHINNYIFTNVSEYGLVARRVGFPYCDRMIFMDIEDVRYGPIIKGNGRMSTPVVRNFAPTPEQTIIYQPIYKYFQNVSPNLYNTKYVLEHSIDPSAGAGGIFYQRCGAPTAYLAPESKLVLTPRVSNKDLFELGIKNYELHNYVLQHTYTTKQAPQHVQMERAIAEQKLVEYNNKKIQLCQYHHRAGTEIKR